MASKRRAVKFVSRRFGALYDRVTLWLAWSQILRLGIRWARNRRHRRTTTGASHGTYFQA